MKRLKKTTNRRGSVSKLPRKPVATLAVALAAAAWAARHEYPELIGWVDVTVQELERAFAASCADSNDVRAPQSMQGGAPQCDAIQTDRQPKVR